MHTQVCKNATADEYECLANVVVGHRDSTICCVVLGNEPKRIWITFESTDKAFHTEMFSRELSLEQIDNLSTVFQYIQAAELLKTKD